MEKYNGTVWRAVTMACRSKNLPIKYWQDVLSDALHSLRSLVLLPMSAFLSSFHVWMLGSPWLTIPGPIYLKRHVRNSKTEPLVDEVELIGANLHNAHIRYPDGRETTASPRHLTVNQRTVCHLQYRYSLNPHLRESQTHTPCLL